MAEVQNYTFIEGKGICGSEKIYPKKIWTPPTYLEAERIVIQFTKIQKGVTEESKNGIVGDGTNGQCFKGNKKQYDKDDVPPARFSWFSVSIGNEALPKIAESQEPGALFCPGKSRYGTKLFTADFGQIIYAYENCCKKKAEISVLGTYEYKREVMHAFVIAPRGANRFAGHPCVAKRTDGGFAWNDNLPEIENILTSPEPGLYRWKTFSTIKWDNASCTSKRWGHLAFAFYLDCLSDKKFVIPNDIGDWEECEESKPFLGSTLIPDNDDDSNSESKEEEGQ